jgi:drug/metabolite transporter (DMT)-like permease
MWVVYTIVFKKLVQHHYSMAFITRKVFFYGILTILPFFPIMGVPFHTEHLLQPVVIGNLLFLGIVASFVCYLTWNCIVNKLGAVVATNYLYINPLATFITSAIVLHEHITMVGLLGALLILFGVYFSQKKRALS